MRIGFKYAILVAVAAIFSLAFGIACSNGDDDPIRDDREYFRQQSQERLQAIDRQISVLSPQVAEQSPDSPVDLEEQLDEIRNDRDDVADNLSELMAATDDNWTDLRDDIDTTLDSIERRLAELDSRT